MTYAEKLRDPRWQRKRLGLLYAAEWTCRTCGDEETELHVHHRYYRAGKMPWEYPDDAFEVLCKDCHKNTKETMELLSERMHYELHMREAIPILTRMNWEESDIICDIICMSSGCDKRYSHLVEAFRNELKSTIKRGVREDA